MFVCNELFFSHLPSSALSADEISPFLSSIFFHRGRPSLSLISPIDRIGRITRRTARGGSARAGLLQSSGSWNVRENGGRACSSGTTAAPPGRLAGHDGSGSHEGARDRL